MEERSLTGIAETAALRPAFILSAALVLMLVVAAIPGVFVAGLYHDPAAIIATDRGSDLVTLFVLALLWRLPFFTPIEDPCALR